VKRLLPCVLACLLGACASPAPTALATVEAREVGGARPPKPAAPSTADELVAYLAGLRALNEAALAAEAASQKRDPSDMGRVKAGLALSLGGQADEAEVLALIEPVEKRDGGNRDLKAMAGFLHAVTLERRRLKESASVRLRDERRVADAQKQRADQLQQKLDALTELEKSLSDRSASSDAQAR
jgi:hypothetical protein